MIARYLDKGKGSIPAPIILSAQAKSNFYFEDGKVNFSRVEGETFLVLDGQHRLFGYEQSEKDYLIPVVIYSELTLSQEVSLFIDINTNQKGVSSALLLDIKQLAGTETSLEEKQRQVFNKLNSSSPLSGFLASNRSVTGRISRKAFNDATKDAFENGPFKNKDIEMIYKGMKNFLEASEIALNNSKAQSARLNKTLIFKSLFRIFNEVVEKALSEKGNLKTGSLSKIIEPISLIDYDSYSGTNNATISRLVSEMKAEINKYSEIKDEMF